MVVRKNGPPDPIFDDRTFSVLKAIEILPQMRWIQRLVPCLPYVWAPCDVAAGNGNLVLVSIERDVPAKSDPLLLFQIGRKCNK